MAPEGRADYVCRITADEGDIGRGTRVRDDYGKLWFKILDYTTEKVVTLCASPVELRAHCAHASQRDFCNAGFEFANRGVYENWN